MLILCLAFFGMSGCSKGDNSQGVNDENKLQVVTTMFPSYDFAKAVFGKKAEVKLLLPPGSEAHSYEPTPQDIKDIGKADLFIYNGGENEAWVDKVLDSIDSDQLKVLAMTDQVKLLDEEIVEGMEDDHDHDHDGDHDEHDGDHEDEHDADHDHDEDHDHEIDEHVWTSPANAIKIATAIAKAGSEIKPKYKEAFESNLKEYVDKLTILDNDFKAAIQNAKHHTLVFADRFPVRYFVEEYGLKYYAAFPGCSTDTEASAATVSFLVDKVKEDKIPVIFTIEMSNQKMAKTIAAETGAEIREFNSCHNLTKEDFDQGKTYLSIMNENLDAVKDALN